MIQQKRMLYELPMITRRRTFERSRRLVRIPQNHRKRWDTEQELQLLSLYTYDYKDLKHNEKIRNISYILERTENSINLRYNKIKKSTVYKYEVKRKYENEYGYPTIPGVYDRLMKMCNYQDTTEDTDSDLSY